MKLNHIVVISMVMLLSACSVRMGQFTAASTHNVRGLDYSIDSGTVTKTEGETCIHTVIIFPIGKFDDRIQRAMDNAINNGRSSGIDGDLLVNVRIEMNKWYLPLIYGRDCMRVEGDLVHLNR